MSVAELHGRTLRARMGFGDVREAYGWWEGPSGDDGDEALPPSKDMGFELKTKQNCVCTQQETQEVM